MFIHLYIKGKYKRETKKDKKIKTYEDEENYNVKVINHYGK